MKLEEAQQILNDKGYILEKALPKYKQFRLHCEERFTEISDQVKEILITEYNLEPEQFQISITESFCTIGIFSNGRRFLVNLSIEDNGKKLYITNYATDRQKILDIEMLDSENLPRIVLDTYNEDLLAKLKEAEEVLNNNGYILEAYDDDYKDDLGDVVNVINKKHEILGTKEVPAEEGYKVYKIVTKDNKFYTLEFKNKFFEYRGRLYPWRLTLSTSKFGFVVIGYNLRQLNDYFNKVK